MSSFCRAQQPDEFSVSEVSWCNQNVLLGHFFEFGNNICVRKQFGFCDVLQLWEKYWEAEIVEKLLDKFLFN